MIFDLDDSIMIGVNNFLEEANNKMSEEAMFHIINQINNAMPGLCELLTQDTADTWRGIASNSSGWGSKYAKIIRSKFSGDEGTVYLDEMMKDSQSKKPNFMFAMMMEQGVKSWSIRDALMKSDKAKEGKDGVKYITIPLSVATPRKSGQGSMSSKFGGREMTSDIYKLVKSGGSAPEGSTITVGTKEINISGLSKYTTRQRHSGYGIFRRVSENSKGWQYPDIAPQPIFDSVIRYVENRMAEVIADFCKAIVEENT